MSVVILRVIDTQTPKPTVEDATEFSAKKCPKICQ